MTALDFIPPSRADLDKARRTVRRVGVVPLRDLEAACAVLAQSPDPDDRMIAREFRNAAWSSAASDLTPAARALAEKLHGKAMAEDANSLGRNASNYARMHEGPRRSRLVLFAIAAAAALLMAGLIHADPIATLASSHVEAAQ